jgi:hypothetical protein
LSGLFSLTLTNVCLAQKDASATYVSASAVLTKTYTEEELKALGKTDLVKIYMERVSIVTEIVPYIALHTKPGATLKEMGIPESSQNVEHLNKEVKNKATYLASVKDTLDDVIFYADKDNIIWCILFFEDVIKRAEKGKE